MVLICKTTLPSSLYTSLAFVTNMAACEMHKIHEGRDNWQSFVEPANQHTTITCQSGAHCQSKALSPAHQANFDCKHPADFESVAEAGGRKAGAILVRFNERDEEGGKQVVNFSLGWEGRASPTPD